MRLQQILCRGKRTQLSVAESWSFYHRSRSDCLYPDDMKMVKLLIPVTSTPQRVPLNPLRLIKSLHTGGGNVLSCDDQVSNKRCQCTDFPSERDMLLSFPRSHKNWQKCVLHEWASGKPKPSVGFSGWIWEAVVTMRAGISSFNKCKKLFPETKTNKKGHISASRRRGHGSAIQGSPGNSVHAGDALKALLRL